MTTLRDKPSISSEEKTLTDFVKEYVRPPKLLIVEDDAFAVEMMTGLLENFEVEVQVSNTGRNACAEMDRQQFDLIILDLGLPDRSYEAVARHIAETQSVTPVVVISGHIDDRCITTINAILNRPVWYIQKPFGFAPEQWVRMFAVLRLRANYKGKFLPSPIRLRYESGSQSN